MDNIASVARNLEEKKRQRDAFNLNDILQGLNSKRDGYELFLFLTTKDRCQCSKKLNDGC